jgi:hypothetical protein
MGPQALLSQGWPVLMGTQSEYDNRFPAGS